MYRSFFFLWINFLKEAINGNVLCFVAIALLSSITWSYGLDDFQSLLSKGPISRIQNLHNKLPLNSLDCNPDHDILVLCGDASSILLVKP
jgi:hypothetical protein